MILYEDRSDLARLKETGKTARGRDVAEVLFKESWDFTSVSRKEFVCV